MKTDKLACNEKKIRELALTIKDYMNKYNDNAVTNIFLSPDIINDETIELAEKAYEFEKLIIKHTLFSQGNYKLAEDFDKSASYKKNKEAIINENITVLQANCKLYGESIEIGLKTVRENFSQYLLFIANDAANSKTFLRQAESDDTIFSFE